MAYKSVHFNAAMYKVSHSFLFLSKVSNIGFARGVFKRSRNYWSNRCFYDMNFAYFCYPNLLSIDVTCRIKWYCWSHFSKWFQIKDFLVWYWLLWSIYSLWKTFRLLISGCSTYTCWIWLSKGNRNWSQFQGET